MARSMAYSEQRNSNEEGSVVCMQRIEFSAFKRYSARILAIAHSILLESFTKKKNNNNKINKIEHIECSGSLQPNEMLDIKMYCLLNE